jgi:integrase
MKVMLTDRLVAGAKARAGGQCEFFDAKVRGLSLRVSAGGARTWSFHYTDTSGRRRRMTLGTYPPLYLAGARAAAIEARALVENGKDPLAQKTVAGTVTDLIEAYLAKHVRPNLRRADQVERRLRKNVIPLIGGVKLADLHRRDVNRVLDPIIERKRPIEANCVHADIRAMLRWAVRRGDLDRDPIAGMPAPSPIRHRDRTLTDPEISKLWSKLGALPIDAQRIIRLCLITAQRIGEIAGMRPGELDLAAREWQLPGSRTKNKHPHRVPLSDLAIIEIGAAFEGFAISAADVTKVVSKVEFGIPHFVPHDLRRTALTGMAKIGIPPLVLGHIANHRTTTKAGMTLSVYVHHAYEKEKREALELWADRLHGIIAGTDVVPMRRLS